MQIRHLFDIERPIAARPDSWQDDSGLLSNVLVVTIFS